MARQSQNHPWRLRKRHARKKQRINLFENYLPAIVEHEICGVRHDEVEDYLFLLGCNQDFTQDNLPVGGKLLGDVAKHGRRYRINEERETRATHEIEILNECNKKLEIELAAIHLKEIVLPKILKHLDLETKNLRRAWKDGLKLKKLNRLRDLRLLKAERKKLFAEFNHKIMQARNRAERNQLRLEFATKLVPIDERIVGDE